MSPHGKSIEDTGYAAFFYSACCGSLRSAMVQAGACVYEAVGTAPPDGLKRQLQGAK